MTNLRTIARQIGGIALAQNVLERLCFGVWLCIDGIPADHEVASSTTSIEAGEMRSRLGATIEPARRPFSWAIDERVSKLACGARVSVTTTPSRIKGLARSNAAPRSGTTATPPQRRPGWPESMTQRTSTEVSPALKTAISAS